MRVRYYAAEWAIFRLLNDSIGPESGRAGHNGGGAKGPGSPGGPTEGLPSNRSYIFAVVIQILIIIFPLGLI